MSILDFFKLVDTIAYLFIFETCYVEWSFCFAGFEFLKGSRGIFGLHFFFVVCNITLISRF